MTSSSASASYTDDAAEPGIWSRPDPALAAAGIEGEYVVARVRLVAMCFLLLAPTWSLVNEPDNPMHVTGFAVTLLGGIAAIAIFMALRRGR